PRLADHKIRGFKTQTNNNAPRLHPPRHTLQAARVSPLTLAAWNVRSLLDNPRSNRSEQRTAPVARDLARYKVDIAAPSETRFSEQGQLEEEGAGYTFFWSGPPKADPMVGLQQPRRWPSLTRVVLPLQLNHDTWWTTAAVWDVRAALFRDSTACLLAEEGARQFALNKYLLSRLLQPAAAHRSQNTRSLNSNKQKYPPSPPPRHTLQAARVSPLTLAAWNVRSLLDNPKRNRPERRTALVARELARYALLSRLLGILERSNRSERRTVLVARELARYKVDIAALSETPLSEQCQLEEVGAGYTFFCSGRPKAERLDAGVAFAIQNDIVGRLPYLPQGHAFHYTAKRGGEGLGPASFVNFRIFVSIATGSFRKVSILQRLYINLQKQDTLLMPTDE
ncbi:unnamed protein product, partial [Schistocephalus solidus]|uniref:Endo/exonuclease/phosphatase domain-containing protein n=1 Tax=Schistocephalus solidus TaxID=70667 RepID=A0A183SGX5_SCHSO